MSASLRAFVCKALERNRISFGDLRRLQRTVLPHGLVTREQAEVLIALEQTIPRTDKAWAGYLVAAITDFVVWRSSSPGRVEPETAAWLVASLSCGRPTRTTGMIARAIVREARHCEEPLLGFALSSPKPPPCQTDRPWLDLNTGFGKFVVGQQLTPTDTIVSITRNGSGRGNQVALASRTLGGRAMRAALNSGPMTPVAGVRRVICRPSWVIVTS